MFNIGPLEFVVLGAIALIVFGPDKLPQLAKDAGRMLRTLRDLAQGARTQLTEELGPGFSDIDLSKLNPRTAIRDAIMGDDDDFASLNPREMLSKALRGEDDPPRPVHPMEQATPARPMDAGTAARPMDAGTAARPSLVKGSVSQPEVGLREGEPAPFDPDTT